MTYQEMQERLTKVETLIQAVQQPRYQNKVQNVQETLTQLNTIKENLENKMKIIAEAEGMITTDDETRAEKLARKGLNVNLKEEEDFKGRNIYDLAINLILGADNPQKSSILIVPGAKKVKIGGATTLSNWELAEFFKQGKDGLKGGDIKDLFEILAKDLEKTKREIEKRTEKIKVEIQTGGIPPRPLLVFKTKFDVNEAFGGEFEQKYAIRVTATLEHAGEVQEIINDNPTLRKAFYSNILFKYGSDVWATNNKDIFIQLLELIQDHDKFIEVLDQTHFLDNLDENTSLREYKAPEGYYFIKIRKDPATQNHFQTVLNDFLDIEYKIHSKDDEGIVLIFPIENYNPDLLKHIDDETMVLGSNIPDIVGKEPKPTDYDKKRDASRDYPQLEEDEMDGGAQQGQLDDEDEIFMPMGDEEDEDQTPVGHDTETSVRKEHHDEAGMEVPTDDHDDLDIGHQDDEPDMLKQTAFEIAMYGAKLYKQLNKYDKMGGEVDFPNWWQSKVILAKDYISKAQHYLDFEDKQPMIDKLALEENVEEPTKKDIKKGEKDSIVKQAKADQDKAKYKALLDEFKEKMIEKGIIDKNGKILDVEKYKIEFAKFQKGKKIKKNIQETKISKKRFKELLAEAYYEVIAEQEAEVNTDNSLEAFFNKYGKADPDKNDPKKKVNPIIALHGSKAAAERDLESEVTINVGAGGESYTFKLKGGQEYYLEKKDGGDQSFWEVQIRGYEHTLDAKGIKDAQQDLRILSKEAPTPSTDDPAEFEDDTSGGADDFTGGGGGGVDTGGGTGTGGEEADIDAETETDTTAPIATGDSELEFDTETEA